MGYKGELTGFPKEVVEKMLDHQEAQGNKRDVKVFENTAKEGVPWGGFNWEETPEGFDFWEEVLVNEFEIFFEKYPKEVNTTKIAKSADEKIAENNKLIVELSHRVSKLEFNAIPKSSITTEPRTYNEHDMRRAWVICHTKEPTEAAFQTWIEDLRKRRNP